jgi:N-acylneuraminate cytidylyltransferase/CMP-N,N'-diacetyllegionaminic acid synthase
MTKRTATICVRKGSKGLPGKNLLLIDGIPLYAHAIRQAKESGLFSEIIVSSDESLILNSAKEFGATFIVERPLELAGDNASKPETIKHAVESCENATGQKFSVVVDLDATSPLRSINDIIGTVELLEKENVSSVITVTNSARNPYFNIVEISESGKLEVVKKHKDHFLSRQTAPKTYDMNAAVHVWQRNSLFLSPKVFYEDTRFFEMPQERSHDIDTDVDFKVVSFLFGLNKENFRNGENNA